MASPRSRNTSLELISGEQSWSLPGRSRTATSDQVGLGQQSPEIVKIRIVVQLHPERFGRASDRRTNPSFVFR